MHVPVTFLLKLIAEWISLLLQILADMSDIEEAFVITKLGHRLLQIRASLIITNWALY